LFDIGVLLDNMGIDVALWRTFLVYLTASPKPAADLLAPNEPREFAAVFDSHFRGMTREPVIVEWLLEARHRLLARVRELMDDPSRDFLLSVEGEVPAFDLIGLPHTINMPGVRRKLQNLAKRTSEKREADIRNLVATLARITEQAP